MSYNILIVDDSKTVRSVLKRSIQMAGIPTKRLDFACNGEDALAPLQGGDIDVVLTDIHMPIMGGIELIETMRSSPKTREIPVIVISSDASAERAEQLCALGVAAVLSKPFSAENIRDAVENALEAA